MTSPKCKVCGWPEHDSLHGPVIGDHPFTPEPAGVKERVPLRGLTVEEALASMQPAGVNMHEITRGYAHEQPAGANDFAIAETEIVAEAGEEFLARYQRYLAGEMTYQELHGLPEPERCQPVRPERLLSASPVIRSAGVIDYETYVGPEQPAGVSDPEEDPKFDLCYRLYSAWLKAPDMRLGQLIAAQGSTGGDYLDRVEDTDLIEAIEEYVKEQGK